MTLCVVGWQVEGLLTTIKDKLVDSNPFAVASADSADPEKRKLFATFIQRIEQVCVVSVLYAC